MRNRKFLLATAAAALGVGLFVGGAQAQNGYGTPAAVGDPLSPETVYVHPIPDRIHRSSGEAARQFEAAYCRLRDLLGSLQFPTLIDSCFGPSEKLCAELLELSAEANDEGTNALMSDYIRAQEKMVWMYSAYLKK